LMDKKRCSSAMKIKVHREEKIDFAGIFF
jgi:hypothetical protein